MPPLRDEPARQSQPGTRLPPLAPRRVLIFGERSSVALAACRALGTAGYEVGVASWRAVEEAGVSRLARRYHRVPPLHEAVAEWTDAVGRIIKLNGYEVAIATTDAVVAALPALHLGIRTCPQMSALHMPLIDKALLTDLCVRTGVAYPRTDRSESLAEDKAAAGRSQSRMVVKAARSAVVSANRVTLAPGATVVDNPASALVALARLRQRGVAAIAQEYLAGDKFQAIIIRRAHTTTCRLAFKVLREFPPDAGSETALLGLSSTEGSGAQIIDMLERLADGVQYEGLLQAEFIRSDDDGELRVIDVNPRLWGSLKLAELLGFRMTERAVRDALGLGVLPMPPEPVGRRYHHLARELRWLRARKGVPPGYASTFSLRDVWDVPSLSDPLPELLRLSRMLLGPRSATPPDQHENAA